MLKGCLEQQGNIIEQGDVLIVRTGWTEAFSALTPEERDQWRLQPDSGIERSEEMLKWHWDLGVAAVAGDS